MNAEREEVEEGRWRRRRRRGRMRRGGGGGIATSFKARGGVPNKREGD